MSSLATYRRLEEESLDRLDEHLQQLKKKEQPHAHGKV